MGKKSTAPTIQIVTPYAALFQPPEKAFPNPTLAEQHKKDMPLHSSALEVDSEDRHHQLDVDRRGSFREFVMEGGGETANVAEGSGPRKCGRVEQYERGRLQGPKRDKCRRENITELYSKLRSMVPSMCLKAPRAEVLQEAFLYIRFLEEERARLEKLKMSSARVTANSSSISVTLSDSHLTVFAITSSIRQNLVTKIVSVFGQHQAEILAANVVAQEGWMSMMVTAAITDVTDGTVEKIKKDILMV